MEKFNIDVFYTNIEALGVEYLIYKNEKSAIEKWNNIDTEIRQLKSFIGMAPIDENSRQLIKLRKYQKLYFNVLKEKEKHLRGINIIYTCLIDNIEMRVFYAKKDIYMTILEALDKLVREISEYTEASNNKATNPIKVTGEVAAVFGYFLIETKYIKGKNRIDRSKKIAEILKSMNVINTKNEPHKSTSIHSQLNTIYSGNGDEILRPAIIDKTRSLLKNYPKALNFAKDSYKGY